MKFKSHTEYTQPDSVSRRGISEVIDDRIDTYIRINTPEDILYKFFGTADLTEDENKKFFIYFKHVARRICAAHIKQDDGNIILDLEDFLNDKIAKILAHDIAHSVEFTGVHHRADNSTLQTFLRSKTNLDVPENEAEDTMLFKQTQEELFGALFQLSNNFYKPVSIEILDTSFNEQLTRELQRSLYEIFPELRNVIDETLSLDMLDFNNYVYKFIVINLYLRDFNQAFNDKRKSPEPEALKYLNKKLEIYKKLLSDDLSGELVDILYYIWSYRDDDRVLVNLFFMMTEDFFKKLDIKYGVV